MLISESFLEVEDYLNHLRIVLQFVIVDNLDNFVLYLILRIDPLSVFVEDEFLELLKLVSFYFVPWYFIVHLVSFFTVV